MKIKHKGFAAGLLVKLKGGARPDYTNAPINLTDEQRVEYEEVTRVLAELSSKLEQSPNPGIRGLDLVISAAALAGSESLHSLVRLEGHLISWGVEEVMLRITGKCNTKGVPSDAMNTPKRNSDDESLLN